MHASFLPRLLATVIAAAPLAQALTEAEITATALFGKTLVFEASNGTGLLPASGTWTGTFKNNAGRDFVIVNNGGIVGDFVSAYTAVNDSNPTIFSLTSVYANSGQATLSLAVSNGQGNYTLSCVFINPPNFVTATQGGTFTIQATTTKTPEIAVKQGSTNLVDGKAKSDFGTVKVGKKSKAKTYTITNKGKATLKNLKITASGAKKKDYVIAPPGATTLAAGKSTTFKITFKPTGKGPRNAALKIASNDADENPFDIKLTGIGKK